MTTHEERGRRRRHRRGRPGAWRYLLPLAATLWLAIAAIATFVGDANAIILGVNAFAPFLAGLTLGTTGIVAATGTKRIAAILLGVAGLLLAWPQATVIDTADAVAAGDGDLVVMTFSTMTRNTEPQAVAGVVLTVKPDVAVLQEVADDTALLPLLSRLYGGAQVYSIADGNFLVVSRFPLTADTRRGRAQRVVVHLPTGDATIWNLHGPKDFWSPSMQRKAYEALYADVAATPGPRIVAGDFNASPRGDFYRIVAQGLTDAHAVAGRGFGFTFPAPARRSGLFGPFLRIDYVFVSDDFTVVSAATLNEAGGSDHFPVVVRLRTH